MYLIIFFQLSNYHPEFSEDENSSLLKIKSNSKFLNPFIPFIPANNGRELFNHDKFASLKPVDKLLGTASNHELNGNGGWRPAVNKGHKRLNIGNIDDIRKNECG